LTSEGADAPITKEVAAGVVKGSDEEIMTLLLDQQGKDVQSLKKW
jgi:hypothetical protein